MRWNEGIVFLLRCVHSFGIIHGLVVWFHLKRNHSKINIPGYPPFHLRLHTTDDETFYQVFVCTDYDIPELKKTNPQYIIDGGGNVGFASIYFAKEFPKSKIISVEPEPSNFVQLIKNTSSFHQIRAIQSALWKSNDSLNILDKGFGEYGFMIEKSEGGNNSLRGISIDELMRQFSISTIDILKLDIEGSEKELFEEGFEKWLPRTKYIVIELHDRLRQGCSKAFFSAISKFDFYYAGRKGENLVFANRLLISA